MIAAGLAGWVAAGLGAGTAGALRRSLDARRETVARACHELRAPLTAVRLGLSLGDLTPAHLRAIDTELQRAALALEDLAAMRGRPDDPPRMRDLEPVELSALLQDAVQAAQVGAGRWGATVAGRWVGPEAVVWGDRTRLAQALGNLIANAVEHGGGAVVVSGCRHRAGARLVVSDEGPGLPAPVTELARRARRGRGTRGRGLAIALAVARAHGGTVSAAPSARGGRIVLALPARAGGCTEA